MGFKIFSSSSACPCPLPPTLVLLPRPEFPLFSYNQEQIVEDGVRWAQMWPPAARAFLSHGLLKRHFIFWKGGGRHSGLWCCSAPTQLELAGGGRVLFFTGWQPGACCNDILFFFILFFFPRDRLSVDVPTRVPVLPQLILLFQREEISSDKSALSRLKTFHTTDGDHKVQVSFQLNRWHPTHLLRCWRF